MSERLRTPSTTDADALALLEAWCVSGKARGYRVDRYEGSGAGYLVVLYATLSMRVVARAEAPTLGDAATAAVIDAERGSA